MTRFELPADESAAKIELAPNWNETIRLRVWIFGVAANTSLERHGVVPVLHVVFHLWTFCRDSRGELSSPRKFLDRGKPATELKAATGATFRFLFSCCLFFVFESNTVQFSLTLNQIKFDSYSFCVARDFQGVA